MVQEYSRILVAIDGSQSAYQALRKAVNVAKRNGAHLFIAHVIDTRAFQPYDSFDSTVADTARSEAENTLAECEQYAKNHGLDNVDSILEFGSPKVLLAKEIPERENIDLIMMGATGLNAVERFFVGSVSENVIRRAECDVLIVRTDLENETPDFIKDLPE